MDGVIVDSMAIHIQAWNRYLEEQGIAVTNLEQRMLGKHNTELVLDLFAGCELTAADVAAHGERKEQLYRDMMADILTEKLVPGVGSFLERHDDLPAGIGSNAEPANVAFVLGRTGLGRYFDAVVDGNQVERPKPHPDVFLKAAEMLGALPDRCIVFEDSPTGVRAARAAGMRVVGVATTCGLADVDFTINNFLEPELDAWIRAAQVE